MNYLCPNHGETSDTYVYTNAAGTRTRVRCRRCHLARSKKYDLTHKDGIAAKMVALGGRVYGRSVERRYRDRLREEVHIAYGSACVCCGETEPKFLTIDHVLNNGAAHKRTGEIGKTGSKLYSWLKRHEFPKDHFQLMCLNCNRGKFLNGGTCPHKARTLRALGYSPE